MWGAISHLLAENRETLKAVSQDEYVTLLELMLSQGATGEQRALIKSLDPTRPVVELDPDQASMDERMQCESTFKS